jgi:hypothetical protein
MMFLEKGIWRVNSRFPSGYEVARLRQAHRHQNWSQAKNKDERFYEILEISKVLMKSN